MNRVPFPLRPSQAPSPEWTDVDLIDPCRRPVVPCESNTTPWVSIHSAAPSNRATPRCFSLHASLLSYSICINKCYSIRIIAHLRLATILTYMYYCLFFDYLWLHDQRSLKTHYCCSLPSFSAFGPAGSVTRWVTHACHKPTLKKNEIEQREIR